MEGEDGQLAGSYSLSDASVACEVRAWLAVLAKHVCFDECVQSAVESISKAFQLASFGGTKCNATHLDSGSFARKKYICYLCKLCVYR